MVTSSKKRTFAHTEGSRTCCMRGNAVAPERLEQPDARQHHLIEALQIWTYAIPGVRNASLPPFTGRPNPLVIPDSVVASVCSPGAISVLDKNSGRLQWSHKLDAFGGSCVIHADGKIYAKSSRTLYCLDATSGHQDWTFSPSLTSRESIYSSATFHRGRVLIGDRAGMFHCLDARSGERMWAHKVSTGRNNQVNSTAAIHDEMAVIGCNDALVAAYDVLTGVVVWKQSIDGPCTTEILTHAGKVFAATRGSVYTLDAATGEILFRKRWQHMEVRSMTMCGDAVVAVLRPEATGSSRVWNRAHTEPLQMVAFSGDSELFHEETAEFIVGIRFDGDSGLIYESRLDGLGIVDPSTGERLHNIHSEVEPVGYGLVDVDAGGIYAMDGSSVYRLRRPLNEP